MTRRALLALALLALLLTLAPVVASGPGVARADVAPSPIFVHIEGQTSLVTTAAPTEATFRVRNDSGEPQEIYLYRAIVRDGGTRLPIEIRRVTVDGHEVGHSVRVPAHGEVTLTIGFELPARMHGRSSWEIDLRVTSSGFGGHDTRPATLARSGSRAKLAVLFPK
jgi:hypothetical protein